MELHLHRIFKGSEYTIGKLYINGEYFCDTLEDKDRGLSQDMPTEEIKHIKVPGKTAVPTGRYKVVLNVKSPRFAAKSQYAFCKGYLPRLMGVPEYSGVLIHIGNVHTDTEGCILVGQNKEKGKVLNSTKMFQKLYPILKIAADKRETIHITID